MFSTELTMTTIKLICSPVLYGCVVPSSPTNHRNILVVAAPVGFMDRLRHATGFVSQSTPVPISSPGDGGMQTHRIANVAIKEDLPALFWSQRNTGRTLSGLELKPFVTWGLIIQVHPQLTQQLVEGAICNPTNVPVPYSTVQHFHKFVLELTNCT